MRTTIVLDDRLVEEARQVIGGESLRAIVEESLREAIRARRRDELRRLLGTMDLAITEGELKAMRRNRVDALAAGGAEV